MVCIPGILILALCPRVAAKAKTKKKLSLNKTLEASHVQFRTAIPQCRFLEKKKQNGVDSHTLSCYVCTNGACDKSMHSHHHLHRQLMSTRLVCKYTESLDMYFQDPAPQTSVHTNMAFFRNMRHKRKT
jgi:hypothetical protein